MTRPTSVENLGLLIFTFVIPFTIALTGIGLRAGRYSSGVSNPNWEIFFGGLALTAALLPVILYRILSRNKKTIKTLLVKSAD
jgi:hypothetical protein